MNRPDNNAVTFINDSDIAEIKRLIPNIIKNTFPNLIQTDQSLLSKHLTNIVLIASLFYYSDKNTFIKQLTLNKNQDIFSLFVLLMPYYNLNTSNKITSLDELFANKGNKAVAEFESSYYIDHEVVNMDEYFTNSTKSAYETFQNTNNKLCYNWTNVFPYTMATFTDSNIYKNFMNKWNARSFNLFAHSLDGVFDVTISAFNKSNYVDNVLLLGYDTLFGCCYNFLYNDIKSIKWMIYDVFYEDKMLPNIIALNKIIPIQNICMKHYDDLDENEKYNLLQNWTMQMKNNINDILPNIKSLILFYLRWEHDETNLIEIDKYLDNNCKSIVKTNIKYIYEDVDATDNLIYNTIGNIEQINACLKQIANIVRFDRLYEYIYVCMQRFRYTWYGYVCLDADKNIKDPKNYLDEYKKNMSINTPAVNLRRITEFTITPKNIYNYFKNLVHHNLNGKFQISSSYQWNALMPNEQTKFIECLNTNDEPPWYNITNNINNLGITGGANIPAYMKTLRKKTHDVIPRIIFETLIYNGILTYTKYNPVITDERLLPSKQNSDERNNYIYNNLEMTDKTLDAYLFWDNLMLKKHDKYKESTGRSYWYMNFGSDWLAQTQIFHHFINQRVIFVTGGTGAGKSTITPFMLVYALKIINYNNNGKVYCTQPRIQPVVDNATWIAYQLGVPIKQNEKKEYIGDSINYIQYKHGDSKKPKLNADAKANASSITDEYYHPTLRLLTDGSLYNTIKKSYIFKAESDKNTNKFEDKFTPTNIFDIILVDEAHEHNVYMDMILTLAKFASYINNQITLGIISATMDTDELIYRKYYNSIDDNWKNPIRIMNTNIANRQLLDRRLHLSIPFGSMNYDVANNYVKNENEFQVLKHILNTTMKGDILIFQAGSNEILKLTKEINDNTRRDVYAIPFYADLNDNIKDNIVKKIAQSDIRNNFRIPKNVPINDYFSVKEEDKVPRGTYQRFVIIATNIAEASITINSLKFIIDTVWQKVNEYDIDTDTSILKTKEISKTNSMQRRGRVGRVSSGVLYRLYDFNSLRDRVDYKICISDITTIIFSLITTTDKQYFLLNDPYKIPTVLPCLVSQYKNSNRITFPKTDTTSVVYPHDDGKYTVSQLSDVDGKLFIVSPDEDELIRANQHNLEITGKLPTYKNKVNKIMEYFQNIGLREKGTNLATSMGTLIESYESIIDNESILLKHLLIFIDCIKLTNDENVINKILLFIVFAIDSPRIKTDRLKTGFADYLVKASVVPNDFYNKININNISNIIFQFNDSFTGINSVILNAIASVKNEYQNTTRDSGMIADVFRLLDNFYVLKVKLMFLTNNHLIMQYLKNTNNLNNPNNHPNVKLLQKILTLNAEILTSVSLNKPMGEYEFTAFVIAKNFVNNILLKVQGTPYYINYFNRDINVFYKIDSYSSYGKTKINTSVDVMYRNNILLHIPNPLNDANTVSNLMMIPYSTIEILRRTIPIKRNTVIDVDRIKKGMISKNNKFTDEYYNEFAQNASKIKETIESE